uniref:GRAM domain-containing protein n=1 Tax=Trichuris muris TaxID=70415 RepID=A0A5S6R0E7_TRIMR
MAVNVDRTPDGKGVILYNGEIVLLYSKEVTLDLGSSEQLVRGKSKGALYLTSHRIIFTAKNPKDRLQSLSMPFHCLRNVKLEQPVLGANFLRGVVLAQPNGNWTGEATFKITFNLGGCIDFGLTMLHAVELARQIHTYAAPPPYAPPPGDFFSPPPAYYTCQGTNFYGINIPVQAFPEGPPPGNVYVYSAAPPFSGVFMPQPSGNFVPPSAPIGNPPPYSAGIPPYPVQQNGVPGQQNAGQGGTSDINPPKSNLPSYDDALRRRR